MAKAEQTYKYKKSESIVNFVSDSYSLTQYEYYVIYSFFVTYSMCGRQSCKKRSLIDYGWANMSLMKSGAKEDLEEILKLDDNENFCFTEADDLKERFEERNLQDGAQMDIDTERAVVSHTQGDNKYFMLFYRIRDGFAHGSYSLGYNSNAEKMVVIQDQDKYNVKARIVIKLSTLIGIVKTIDKARLVITDNIENPENKEVA